VLSVAPDRFSAGWRLLPQPDFVVAPIAPSPDLVVDLVRAADLAALTVEGYGVELLSGNRPRVRAKRGAAGRLVVRFAYQHTAERAIYEEASPIPFPDPTKAPAGKPDPTKKPVTQQPPAGEPSTHTPPIEARPARASRLVLELAEGEEIAFTTEGFLEALSRLPMLVHPLATPRADRVTVPADAPFLHLPGGLVATVTPDELVISRAPRGVAIPDPSTAEGLSRLSRDGRRVRALLATRAGISRPRSRLPTG
jgi:hypothetical protein